MLQKLRELSKNLAIYGLGDVSIQVVNFALLRVYVQYLSPEDYGVHIDRDLSRIARHHSLKMAEQQSLFHTTNPSSVYLKGISWHYWGENVGVTGGTVGDLESAFMASLPHRHNILNRTFRHVAIGAVRVDGVLWVTVFFYG